MKTRKIPLWQSVCNEIKRDIKCQKYKKGDVMPTEHKLAELYYVSRITIRSALGKLADLGMVKRVKGKGTIVLEERITEPLLKIKGFTAEMKSLGLIPSTSYASMEKSQASGYVAEIFNLKTNTKFNVIRRVRCINGVPVGYFVTYIRPDIHLDENEDLYYGSLYDLLEEKLISIDLVKQTISAELADSKTIEMLDMVKGEAVVVMKRFAYMKGDLIEYSVCKYDGKRYEYNMQLKKS